jgi:hypothetical protein
MSNQPTDQPKEPTDQPTDFEDSRTKTTEKNRVKTTIANVYNNLVNVTVVTAVGNLQVDLTTQTGSEKLHLTVQPGGVLRSFVTQIDLLEGDVLATLPDNFDELKSVQELHERNVEMAAKVLPNNIAALVNAGRELIRLFDAP